MYCIDVDIWFCVRSPLSDFNRDYWNARRYVYFCIYFVVWRHFCITRSAGDKGKKPSGNHETARKLILLEI